MKIILIGPRSIVPNVFDGIVWNFLFPLQSIGHHTVLFDSSRFGNEALRGLIDAFEPDLLFCIMTGSRHYCPDEPWATVAEETRKKRIKTFNWFADDAWRFDKWSSEVCKAFRACSTSEPSKVEEYKKIGYENIFEANWHANPDLYSGLVSEKKYGVTFVGRAYGDRKVAIDHLVAAGINVNVFSDISFEKMVHVMNESLICLNFSKNPNAPPEEPYQMKGRIFEVIACNSLLVTETTPGLDKYLIDGKECVVFSDNDDLAAKLTELLDNPEQASILSNAGYERFLADHTSQNRLSTLLKQIEAI